MSCKYDTVGCTKHRRCRPCLKDHDDIFNPLQKDAIYQSLPKRSPERKAYIAALLKLPPLSSGLDTIRQLLPPRVNAPRVGTGFTGERHVAGYVYFIEDPLTPDRVKGGGSNDIRSRLNAAELWTNYRARVAGYVRVDDWRKAERDLLDEFQSVRDGEWYPREVMNRIPGLIRL